MKINRLRDCHISLTCDVPIYGVISSSRQVSLKRFGSVGLLLLGQVCALYLLVHFCGQVTPVDSSCLWTVLPTEIEMPDSPQAVHNTCMCGLVVGLQALPRSGVDHWAYTEEVKGPAVLCDCPGCSVFTAVNYGMHVRTHTSTIVYCC